MMDRSAMSRVFSVLFGLTLAAFTTGCETHNSEYEGGDVLEIAAAPSQTEAGLLMLLNDAGTTYAVLDVDAGIDARAASNIIRHRNGYDGMYGTEDDQLFGSMREVDDVERVGPATLERLVAYAFSRGYMER